MKKTLVCSLLLAAALAPSLGHAQPYPSRVVTIVVPFPAGGSNDIVGRYLADSLGKLWKQPVIVENRPGGGSSIGSAYVAKSAPDGYRMVLVSSSYTTNAATRTDQGFDPLKDLKPVSMVATGQVVVAAGPRATMATLADLARESKTRQVFYGTAGIGSSQHFNGELLNDAMGIKMTPVPYKGGQEALIDLYAGRIDLVVGTLGGVLGSIHGGRAKGIAVLGKTRSAALPGVQTAIEAGYPAAITLNCWAVFVPSATPDALVSKLNEDIKTVTHTPEGQQLLAKIDSEPTDLSPKDVQAYVVKEIDYWTRLAKKLNLSEK